MRCALSLAWSKGVRKSYAYYVCQTKSCESYGKSIPRAKLEGAFEAFLQRRTPSATMFELARAMFKDIWDERVRQGSAQIKALKVQIAEAEKQSEKLSR